ncbi:hypothetical protein KPL46_24400, partial [Clostridium estertheticum]|nr:hypothetical protein [Clostridium estertheticum]
FYVNPAYTSQMGKIKYMKAKGISIHVSAAYCIARKALGYKEKIPLIYRTFTNNWRVLSKELKTLKIQYLYKISSTLGYSNLKAFVKDTIVVINNNVLVLDGASGPLTIGTIYKLIYITQILKVVKINS